MKFLVALGTLMLASAAHQTADAATSPYSDFDVISVVPRNPNIKPLVMPIPANAPDKQLASKGARPSEAGR
jgi:hypothetical protein